jgi:hypothetical protein
MAGQNGYHVHDRQLYEALGEPRHPHRKAVPARQVIDRLMRLDAVMEHATRHSDGLRGLHRRNELPQGNGSRREPLRNQPPNRPTSSPS